jgi:hypothetical protein
MPFLDFLQKLPLPILCVVTVVLSLLAGWIILRIVRWGLRVRDWDPAKPINIPELVTVTSVLFALMLSFSAAGVWNDWQQAQGAVRREALALENVIGLANGLPPERGQKLKERVLAYTKAAADHEWPAMARRADTDDPIFKALDGVLATDRRTVTRDRPGGYLADHADAAAADFRSPERPPGTTEHGAFLDLRSTMVRARGFDRERAGVRRVDLQ